MNERWLSIDEIREYLGVSNDTIYRWIELKEMPASKIGRFWKFKKDKIDEWIEAGGAANNPNGHSQREVK